MLGSDECLAFLDNRHSISRTCCDSVPLDVAGVKCSEILKATTGKFCWEEPLEVTWQCRCDLDTSGLHGAEEDLLKGVEK